MSQIKKSLKDNLSSIDFKYDSFFSLKHESYPCSDSFSFNSYEALKNLNDVKMNNYSILMLSKRMKTSDWLNYSKRDDEDYLTIISTLSFRTANAYDAVLPGVFLYFNKNYEFWDINLKNVDYLLLENRPTDSYLNYIFNLNFISETEMTISHNFGDLIFYLCVNEDMSIRFTTEYSDNCVFLYTLDNSYLRLYKKLITYDITYEEITKVDENGDTLVVTEEAKRTPKNNLFVVCLGSGQNGSHILSLDSKLEESSDSYFYINNNILDFDFYCNNSWVSYDGKDNISSISNDKSAFNLRSQFLFHYQYNDDNHINFIPLKNTQTYKGENIRGSYKIGTSLNNPDVNFKVYSSINSGYNQEFGSDNIMLNFVFTDQTYEINDGEDFSFRIEDNGDYPMLPFTQININDSKLIKNGSFGSSSPHFADKMKCTQSHIGTKLDSVTPNNGTYLCTWLYKPSHEADAVWMDRYYYPDMISRRKALTGVSTFKESFDNYLDKNYKLGNDETISNLSKEESDELKKSIEKTIEQNSYFDKVSDMVITPNKNYIYSRLSSDMVSNEIESLSPYLIKNIENKSGVEIEAENAINFDNDTWFKINHKKFNKTNQINFNTDIYISPKKKMGLQLFGTDYKHGFNIQNRKDLCPFFYMASDTCLYVINNNYEISRKFDFSEKYGDKIMKYVLGDMFDDIIVIAPLHFYILTYDLQLKTRISYTDILNIDNIQINFNEETYKSGNILNYPYVNYSMIIQKDNTNGSTKITKDGAGFMKMKFSPNKNNSLVLHESSITSGEIIINTRISKIITSGNPIIYKNNLYIPCYSKILKIIFVPDSDNDNFTQKDREEYACKIRELNTDEYYLNYVANNYGSNTESTEETTSFENEFIEVQNIIKNIFVDSNGYIYGFNYDRIAMSGDGDTLYGIYSWDKYINSGGWWWVYNQSLSKLKSNIDTSKYAEFSSSDSIDMICFNDENYMAMVRNFHNLESNTLAGNKRFDIYDKTKEIIYTYDLTSYSDIKSIDSYSYIDEKDVEHKVFAFTVISGNYPQVILYDVNSKTINIMEFNANDSFVLNENFYSLVNSNSIMRYSDNKNALYFNLFIPNSYLYDYIAQIVWDISESQEGWYNINCSIDIDSAEFVLRINDEIYDSISYNDVDINNNKLYPWFEPYVNSNGNTFDTTYYIGCTGKRYGTTLDRLLTYSIHDPYAIKNTKWKNLSIYNKKLTYCEYQAMRLKNKKINPLIITMPCGIRNSVEEIVRYFKYNMPSSISNHIKINISGLNDTIPDNYRLKFKNELFNSLKKETDGLIKIDDIEFID